MTTNNPNENINGQLRRNRSMLQRTAEEAKKYRIYMKLGRALITSLVILTVTVYIVSVLYMKTGSFTVNLNKFDANQFNLTLSEKKYDGDKASLAGMTSNLNADIDEYMTNISGDSIPADVTMTNGVHNGDNYIAYTFYLVNAGDLNVTYEYSLTIKNITNNLDGAIRVRLYCDEDYITYAKTKSDGSGPEYGTTEFLSSSVIVEERVEEFEPGTSRKYTVVIWIEGDDPDCTDALIGGRLKIDMIFKAVY